MTTTKDTSTHPTGTTYDVSLYGRAARARGVTLTDAIRALRTLRSEDSETDAVLVAHLPDGTRIVGCTGDWESPVV